MTYNPRVLLVHPCVTSTGSCVEPRRFRELKFFQQFTRPKAYEFHSAGLEPPCHRCSTKMTTPDQYPISVDLEEFEDEGHEEIVALGRCEEPEGEQNGQSPSHLPFAPSSVLPDTTTVDPSYIISLIRKLLPDNTSALKSSEYVTCSFPAETSKLYSVEENINGKSNHVEKVVDIEANNNAEQHNIVYDRYVGSINHQFDDQTYSSTSICNGMTPDSGTEDTITYDHVTGFLHKENAWEDSGCILWDLSASRTHAEFMVNNYLLEVLLASLHASKSPRITEICLGILGNLACHEVASNAITSKDGLIETIVDQLYLDDAPCLVETFRILTASLQGSQFTLWAKALLPEQTCLRMIWIVGNTLNTMLLEKGIDFLLTVINNKEVANILLLPWIKWGLPNLVVNLLSSELSYLDDESKIERTSFLDPVLCLVETLSTVDYGLEMIFPNEELCHLVCSVIKLPDKFEHTSARISAVVIIANLLADGPHIASQLSKDYKFTQDLLETIPLVSDDPQARNALWCVLERLFDKISEKDIEIFQLHHLVLFLLDKSDLITEDLDGHYREDLSSQDNSTCSGVIVKTLLRINCMVQRWLARKLENVEDILNIADAEVKAERLKQYCEKFNSLFSAPTA